MNCRPKTFYENVLSVAQGISSSRSNKVLHLPSKGDAFVSDVSLNFVGRVSQVAPNYFERLHVIEIFLEESLRDITSE